MPVFFQKISDKQFDAEAAFEVRESSGMNVMIGFFSLFFVAASASISLWLSILPFALAVVFLAKATRKPTIMIVNKQGFFYYGRLITNWKNFVAVEFADEIRIPDENSSGLGDNFSLLIKYYKDEQAGCYQCKIPLTNTQDKAEEEIIAAIQFYYRCYLQG